MPRATSSKRSKVALEPDVVRRVALVVLDVQVVLVAQVLLERRCNRQTIKVAAAAEATSSPRRR